MRVGDYRVVYRIDDRARLVEIERVRHRRDVYRGL
jgi:mRNA-degrading endonuclease RelE of RelBE toxin-antitoxin system